uniref:PAZ domain-containing protein n=1 Tax=Ditylenchus dipsaci TaxID=166011 RepID=A0A915EA06_9BILA
MDHAKHGFGEEDAAQFTDTQSYLAIGANKAVRFIEGPSENGRSMGVVVQTKKTPFHSEIPLLKKAIAYISPNDLNRFREPDRAKLDSFLRGLWVQTVHGKNIQRFCIMKVAKGQPERQYKLALTAPTAPLIECKGRRGAVLYFPMELCFVCENQRVKTEQQTPAMTQISIRNVQFLQLS